MQEQKPHISFVGAGNIAWHLAPALYKKNYTIDTIYNRNIEHAKSLATTIHAEARGLNELQQISSDILIIAVADHAISSIVKRLPKSKFMLVHTAGSVDMQSLATYGHQNIGVLYPLQSFSKQQVINISQLPFFIETAVESDLKRLENIAKSLSSQVIHADSTQRQQLHIAAVFACNFSNALYSIADKLLQNNDLDFSLLAPLIQETTAKALSMPPKMAQTGPALRKDNNTIAKHLQALETHPEEKYIYQILSQYIENQNTEKHEL